MARRARVRRARAQPWRSSDRAHGGGNLFRSDASAIPHRVTPVAVHAYLTDIISSDYLTLDARSHRGLLDHLAEHDVTGGATYDALVGLTAKAAGATLLTRDLRAVRIYERLRVEFELVT
jgi:hypothetical protein